MDRIPVNETTPFGELLRRHRLAAGISQESLAERARISASAVGALERGARRAPYRDTVSLLAAALALSHVDCAGLEAAAERARGRRSLPAAEPRATHNLPTRLSSFVGRDAEMHEIDALLTGHRLVTVTGSAGVGKTRTALEVAARRTDRHREVWFVDLSSVADEAFVPSAIASVVAAEFSQEANSVTLLAARLRTRELLLVLDNCEHIVGAAATAAAVILRGCPGIAILATSRERLAIEGERVYRLPSLPVPAAAVSTEEEAFACPALRLFLERAMAIESRLALTPERLKTAGDICRRLEGIPLAIELAASRLPALGFDALNERLREHLDLAGGARDLPDRQRTMLATIAWSFDLLNEAERTLLRRLAIFRGEVGVEAAEEVCSNETLAAPAVSGLLASLVDKSLLTLTPGKERSRYAMLDSVRAFAATRLVAAGELAPMARAHASWLADVAERAAERYPNVSRNQWLLEFGPELDDARGALDWAANAASEADALLGARIVGGLRPLWIATNRRVECSRFAQAALERVDESRHPTIAASVMRAHIASLDGAAIFAAAERAIPMFERIGDSRALMSLHAYVAQEHCQRGAFAEAERWIERAFVLANEERIQHSRQYVHLLRNRSLIRALAGRRDDGLRDSAAAARLAETLGEEDWASQSYLEAFFAFTNGDFRRCAHLLEASADHSVEQSQSPAAALSDLAATRIVLGEIDAAEAAAHESLERARFEQHDVAWRAIQHLAALAALHGNAAAAARLNGFVTSWCERQGRIREDYERASYDTLVRSLADQLPLNAIATFAGQGALLRLEPAAEEALGL
jgi:predicted ATPase/transcriptional regulator with XRE-family HTH domain